MRIITFMTVAALAVPSAALAQNNSGGNGDAPQNKGSTGWTGAHPETGGATLDSAKSGESRSTTTGQVVIVHDEAETKDQPVTATGQDLKGPGTQFPPSKTPE